MLLGVLDIGSNSAQLQVFEARPGAPPLPTHAVKEPTLLGEAFGPDGAIEPAGVDRVVEAVNRAMGAARRLGVQQLYVFTTSAVRDAANRDLILDRVEAEAGVRPQYLSGEDEARLTYLAVHQWYGWSAGRLLAALRARERAKLTGVSRPRSRQIAAGAVVARAGMKALNVNAVDVCPWALREGIILHCLQTTFNQSFDLPLRPLNGSTYGQDTPGGRHVTL